MDRFEVSQLKMGEEILVKTESGSTYHLVAESTPEPLDEALRLFKGFRATRESDHPIEGDPELIEDEPAILIVRSTGENGVLQASDRMELAWDRDHPENKKGWDIQFGPKFRNVTTSRILDIEVVPVGE